MATLGLEVLFVLNKVAVACEHITAVPWRQQWKGFGEVRSLVNFASFFSVKRYKKLDKF